jgi:hypothetical protein
METGIIECNITVMKMASLATPNLIVDIVETGSAGHKKIELIC